MCIKGSSAVICLWQGTFVCHGNSLAVPFECLRQFTTVADAPYASARMRCAMRVRRRTGKAYQVLRYEIDGQMQSPFGCGWMRVASCMAWFTAHNSSNS